jgi:hypothetical protein
MAAIRFLYTTGRALSEVFSPFSLMPGGGQGAKK